ncbi:hypothetical protein RvY_05658 [Ramazzottius varieornatus]|uniref:Core Histone H2A/H2B/H3 domain-containing protein n=1 Tax=Ramazzottius varieornatus TaxID=947166 RepID=A0A1D1UWC8_RAMVA|nr:hypothetical protein RvY_05658 [Ramazzottius varieornatus]
MPEKDTKAPELVIPPFRFQRLVREIVSELGDYRFRSDALKALQIGAEDFMKEVMQEGNVNCEASGRNTLFPEDIQVPYCGLALVDLWP